MSEQAPPPRRKRSRRKFIALTLLTGALLSLVVAEVVVRLFVTVRNVGPSFTLPDPIYGKRLKPSATLVRIAPEFRMTMTTNSLGFRGPEPSGSLAGGVLFIGDSFTMGYGVDDGQEYPALVRQGLAGRCTVTNAGVGDTGEGRWVKLLAREAPALAPRVVVLQLSDNDFEDNRKERMFELDPEGKLVELAPPPPKWRGFQAVVDGVPGLSSLYLVGLLRQVLGAGQRPAVLKDPDSAEAKAYQARTRALTWALVRRALEECKRQGWGCLLFDVGLAEPDTAALAAIASEAGVGLVRMPSKKEKPELYFAVDGHWIPAGHELAAKLVLDELRARRLLD